MHSNIQIDLDNVGQGKNIQNKSAEKFQRVKYTKSRAGPWKRLTAV